MRRARKRLRDVDAERDRRQAPAKSDPDGILERVPEAIERVAEVEERRHAEVARQVPLYLERAGQQMLAADFDRHGVAVSVELLQTGCSGSITGSVGDSSL